MDARERHFHGGFWRGRFEADTQGGRQRARHEDDAAGVALAAPRNPNAFAEEESAEKAEAVAEIGNAGFALVEFEMALSEQGFGLQERLLGFFGGLGEDDEIVGIADEFAARFFEFAVEIFEEEIGEDRGDGEPCGMPARSGRILEPFQMGALIQSLGGLGCCRRGGAARR